MIATATATPLPVANPVTRGHDERQLCKRVYCVACGLTKPKRGGWGEACAPVPPEKRRMYG